MESFPFGMPVEPLVQKDRSRKRVFVLGVYASAVHARWLDANGRTVINALAMASEPEIFWRGENAAAIVENIAVPPSAGRLVAANDKVNGPSGRALDSNSNSNLGPVALPSLPLLLHRIAINSSLQSKILS